MFSVYKRAVQSNCGAFSNYDHNNFTYGFLEDVHLSGTCAGNLYCNHDRYVVNKRFLYSDISKMIVVVYTRQSFFLDTNQFVVAKDLVQYGLKDYTVIVRLTKQIFQLLDTSV